MSLKLTIERHRDALREVVSIVVNGNKAFLAPRWGDVAQGVVAVIPGPGADRGEVQTLLRLKADPGNPSILHTRNPRLLLVALRWLLYKSDIDVPGKIHDVEEDDEAAREDFEDLEDRYGHVIAAAWRQ